jgi:xanthine dehydrogenase accessory factor
MINPVYQALVEAAENGERVTLGLISDVKSSSPQKVGAKAVFYPDGRIKGTLGGGCLEAEIQKRAIAALRSGEAATFELLLDHDFGWDDGLICGGKVSGLILPNAQKIGVEFWSELQNRSATVSWGVKPDYSLITSHTPSTLTGCLYQETITPPCALWIAGAGHIARAVAPLALQLDFDVTIFDDRPSLVSHEFFPKEAKLQADDWDKLLTVPLPSVPSFGLIVTRGHRHDALVLAKWIHQPFQFLGMIGSTRKARTIFEHLADEHIATPEELAKVACPVGIKIGSRTVQEIAISIVAQYIDKRAEVPASSR